MQSSWHFYLQFVLERVSLTLYFDKTAKLPVHNLSLSYLQIQLVRSAPNLGSGSLWEAPSLFFLPAIFCPACSLCFFVWGKQTEFDFKFFPYSFFPSSVFKLSSYCPNAMLTIQCRQQYFFLSRTKQNKELTITTYRNIIATTSNSPRKFLLKDITSWEL